MGRRCSIPVHLIHDIFEIVLLSLPLLLLTVLGFFYAGMNGRMKELWRDEKENERNYLNE